jgi:hypothetical protein
MSNSTVSIDAPRRAISRWPLDLLIAVAVLATSVVLAFAGIKSDVRNSTTLIEQHERAIEALRDQAAADRELLLELNGDVKAIRALMEESRKR